MEVNPLNAELNPICHLLALLRAHHILHISRIRLKYIFIKKWILWGMECINSTTVTYVLCDEAI